MAICNPFAFRSGPVTFWTTALYLGLAIALLYLHETLPPAPRPGSLDPKLSLSEAWLDLQTVTRSYHPYNSHQNDDVRAHLLGRARQILDRNGVNYSTETLARDAPTPAEASSPAVVIFDDRLANVTYAEAGANGWTAQYFEGNNFYLYIRGSNDPSGNWWRWAEADRSRALRRSAGVLVNCHFDSVSTGYGATDDGMACVAMLQLLSYFTSNARQPQNGIVLLFNNAEEDGLLGARAFAHSPLQPFCHSFVNLEGAGAGGRAMLFRTTDLEAARAYSKAPHPFGSIVAANAFQQGFIRSRTDYEIFDQVYGQRGLDIAFYAPRSRYHTEEDDSRHTSVDSIWHMLSASLATTEALSKTATTTHFSGPRPDGRKDLVQSGRPTEGVWFDWLGCAWAAFTLRGLFAWSLTLLVASPLTLILVTYLLARSDRSYFFASEPPKPLSAPAGAAVALRGWRGFFRFPLALIFASALTIGSVLLLAKVNPLIVYSSSYAVWAMTLSLFYMAFWLIMRGSSAVRPSALHRGFALIWLFVITWTFQVFAALAEDRMQLGAFYFAAFFHTAVFLALLISLLEQCALPSKHKLAGLSEEEVAAGEQGHRNSHNNSDDDDDDDDEAANERTGLHEGTDDETEDTTERTPLIADEQRHRARPQTTFASAYRRSNSEAETPRRTSSKLQPYEGEQSWSGHLPSWTWLLQLLILAPVHLILLGNLGLVAVASTAMTGPDGSDLLVPLMGIGVISILLLLPLTPFLHRVTVHLPALLLIVFAGTLVYNLAAFPFSIGNRYRFMFRQTVDLDKGTNIVTLTGFEAYVRPIIATLPAAADRKIECHGLGGGGLAECQYDASSLPPDPAGGRTLGEVLSAEVALSSDGQTARIGIEAANTRMCLVNFSQPVFGLLVDGALGEDDRFGSWPSDGLSTVQLWRRAWDGSWNLTVGLGSTLGHLGTSPLTSDRPGLAGEESTQPLRDELQLTVRCGWDDANGPSTVPALEELVKYMPGWAIATKRASGLVQVCRTYKATL